MNHLESMTKWLRPLTLKPGNWFLHEPMALQGDAPIHFCLVLPEVKTNLEKYVDEITTPSQHKLGI